MTSVRPSPASSQTAQIISQWISWALEPLWLLTVVLVPLVFLGQDYIRSEAVIAYVEVPKIALLRTLVGLMVVLWLLEWGLLGNLPFCSRQGETGPRFRPSVWRTQLTGWLRARPTHWIVLAVWFFAVSTLLSTALSASFSVSLWGEVPGQDGFATYTVLCYVLLFGLIATHLNTPGQLWRLLGAIVMAGFLVSGYAVLQHYGYDWFDILEVTGGSGIRATSTVGNAVFAGAVMLLPIGVSLMLATISLSKLAVTIDSRPVLKLKIIFSAALVLWVLVLTVEFLGIIFTFSRGPWLGTILTLGGFMVLAAFFAGWRAASWAALVTLVSGLAAWWLLQGLGTTPTSGAGLWLVAAPILVVLITIGAALGRQRLIRGIPAVTSSFLQSVLPLTSRNPWVVRVLGLLAGIVVMGGVPAVVLFTPLGDEGGGLGDVPSTPSAASDPALAVQKRFASITREVASGNLSLRGEIWQRSWVLIQGHPWFDFQSLSLPWLRPVVGYGPDLYRYTYLRVSRPSGDRLLPPEPDHAHNFMLHQWVEQGVLGLLSSLGLFGAVLGAGSYLLLSNRGIYPDVQRLVLVGLLAVIAGRFLEQIVGVARVSDLTVFWVLLAVFAALPSIFRPSDEEKLPMPELSAQPPRRRSSNRPRSGRHGQSSAYNWWQLGKLAVVAWAIGGIVAVTWVKTINYPRAAILAGAAVERFQQGDIPGSLSSLEHAARLAPDVSTYHLFQSSIYTAYLQDPQLPPEAECSLQLDGTPYNVCLVEKIYINNLAATQQRPLYWRARLALADAALALGRHEEAIRLYEETISLVPRSWPLLNRLAEAYIDVGQPEHAQGVLEDSLAITQDTPNSEQALNLQKLAYQEIEGVETPD